MSICVVPFVVCLVLRSLRFTACRVLSRHSGDHLGRGPQGQARQEGPVQAETQKEVKRVPARPISRNPSANPIFHGTS